MTWKGADRGREQFLRREAWYKVLKILSTHEGESHRDLNSSVFTDLESGFPGVPWKGKDGNRSFFRDYAEAWTTPGVVSRFADTEGKIELTASGWSLVNDPSAVTEFFREHLDQYVEVHTLFGEDHFLWPFAYISSILSVQAEVDIDQLQHFAEMLASDDAGSPGQKLFPEKNDNNNRRFRSYLIMLENADAITRSGKTVYAKDHDYLRSMALIESDSSDGGEVADIDALLEDKRTFVTRQAVQREQQRKFSDSLMEAYSGACCISGNTERAVLEGAHILPYRGRQSNEVTNGLLLSVDVHRLFDRSLLGINPDDFSIRFSPTVKESRYTDLEGSKIDLPKSEGQQPDRDALTYRFDEFERQWPESGS